MSAYVLTVLRSGGEYTAFHVDRLRSQIKRHNPSVDFICLRDDGVDQPLLQNWPGWWSKIECFSRLGPVLYMDLDTTVLGDISPFLNVAGRYEFVALRDFNPQAREMGSGLMAWSGDMSHVYEAFVRDPNFHIGNNRSGRWLGDQGFIERMTEGRIYWQDVLPNMVVSYKKHCVNRVPDNARIVCFHGKPRPWDVPGW